MRNQNYKLESNDNPTLMSRHTHNGNSELFVLIQGRPPYAVKEMDRKLTWFNLSSMEMEKNIQYPAGAVA